MLTAPFIETLCDLRIFFFLQIFTMLPVVQMLGGLLLHTVIFKRWSLATFIKKSWRLHYFSLHWFFWCEIYVTVEMSQPQMKISRCSLLQHMSYWLCTSSTDSAFSSKICVGCWFMLLAIRMHCRRCVWCIIMLEAYPSGILEIHLKHTRGQSVGGDFVSAVVRGAQGLNIKVTVLQ